MYLLVTLSIIDSETSKLVYLVLMRFLSLVISILFVHLRVFIMVLSCIMIIILLMVFFVDLSLCCRCWISGRNVLVLVFHFHPFHYLRFSIISSIIYYDYHPIDDYDYFFVCRDLSVCCGCWISGRNVFGYSVTIGVLTRS